MTTLSTVSLIGQKQKKSQSITKINEGVTLSYKNIRLKSKFLIQNLMKGQW